MLNNNSYKTFVEQVRASVNIYDVISAYLPLTKRGKDYWGCCPFHHEKTPSFSVNAEKGFFYCFGCHQGGDAFKFISMIENIGYGDAIKLLGEKLGIKPPTFKQSANSIRQEKLHKDLLNVMQLARNFFHNCLTKTPYGTDCLQYLKGRNITAEIVEQFQLGFSPPHWNKLHRSFSKRGINTDLLLKAGLIVAKKNAPGFYDRFRGRFMIPIADENGNIVAFGGRIMQNGQQPKYLNSPETMLFNKKRLLFGLNIAKQAIRHDDFVIVVEGYMDAISLFAHGTKNVVASLGTAFTKEHCQKIKRYTKNIYFCYDSDSAGQNATIRALNIAKQQQLNAKVIFIPDGKDPDEFIRNHTPQEFQKLIESAFSFIAFYLFYIKNNFKLNTLEGKLKAIQFILPALASVDNFVELNDYLAQLAALLHVDEVGIRQELARYDKKNNAFLVIKKPLKSSNDAVLKAARYLIASIWYKPNLLTMILGALKSVEVFMDARHREIIAFFQDNEHVGWQEELAITKLSEKAFNELSCCLMTNLEAQKEGLKDCIRVLRREYLNKLYQQHSQKAILLEKNGDNNFENELRQMQLIKQEISTL